MGCRLTSSARTWNPFEKLWGAFSSTLMRNLSFEQRNIVGRNCRFSGTLGFEVSEYLCQTRLQKLEGSRKFQHNWCYVNIFDGIDQYITHKRRLGFIYEREAARLQAFGQHEGNIELSEIRSFQVMRYLDGKPCATATWRQEYQVLSRFFQFWAFRDQMSLLILPPNRPVVRRTYVPYVFNRTDIRSLIRATRQNDNTRSKIDHYAIRALIIFLYATGAGVGEALNLACSDVDISTRLIRVRARFAARNRTIPMGKDICEVLRKYLAWRIRRGYRCQHLFVTKRDEC